MPVSPVKVQGDSIGLDFGSGNWLWTGATKLQLDNSSQYLQGSSSTRVVLNAATTLILGISGTNEVKITEDGLQFLQGSDNVGFDWSTALELDVKVDGQAQVTFTNGTFEPVTNDDIDLGTNVRQFKDAWLSGDIRAEGFIALGDPGAGAGGTIVWTGTTVAKSFGGPAFPPLPSGYTTIGTIWLKCYADGVEGAVPFWRKT